MSCQVCGSEKHEEGWCRKIRTVSIQRAVRDKETDRQLRLYKKARDEGHQPQSTSIGRTGYTHAEEAMAFADVHGRPFRADDMARTINPELADTIRPLTAAEKEVGRATS